MNSTQLWTLTDGHAGNRRQADALAATLGCGTFTDWSLQPRLPWSVLAPRRFTGAGNAFGFIDEQTTRGLQVEAPIATPYLWGALLGQRGFAVSYSFELLTFQVTGTEIDTLEAMLRQDGLTHDFEADFNTRS